MTTPSSSLGGFAGLFGARPADYTAEEQRNIDTVLALRRVAMSERRRFQADGHVHHRHGIVHIGQLNPDGPQGMTPRSIPDRVDEMIDIIAKDDRVWALWHVTGTHGSDIYGMPATGRPIKMIELGVWRFVDGLVAESWFFADELGLLRQLGKIADPDWW
jgi:predicted ester cyclase